jgi:hypothetical protein
MIGYVVDVEPHRARDVPGLVLGGGIALLRRQIERAVDHDQIR